jgi:hypothetical protein
MTSWENGRRCSKNKYWACYLLKGVLVVYRYEHKLLRYEEVPNRIELKKEI